MERCSCPSIVLAVLGEHEDAILLCLLLCLPFLSPSPLLPMSFNALPWLVARAGPDLVGPLSAILVGLSTRRSRHGQEELARHLGEIPSAGAGG